MKLAAIIQARMESERLPGKSLMEICGKPMLQHVVERTQQAIPDVYIVTPSQVIIEFAISHNIPFAVDRYPRNVLDSYYNCANVNNITDIVRITADNPLINPDVIKKVVKVYLEGNYDYVSNNLKRTYPMGLDTEVFSFKALQEAWWDATDAYDKEHVTPYIYHHPELFKLKNVENDKDESSIRLTVDTKEDFQRVKEIYEN